MALESLFVLLDLLGVEVNLGDLVRLQFLQLLRLLEFHPKSQFRLEPLVGRHDGETLHLFVEILFLASGFQLAESAASLANSWKI